MPKQKKIKTGNNADPIQLEKDSTHTITLSKDVCITLSEDVYQLLMNKRESTGKTDSEIIHLLFKELQKSKDDAAEDQYLLKEVKKALTHDKKYRTVKKRRDALQRKVQILKTALKLFSQNGYYSVTVNDIIKEVDITRPTFYQHFKNKENIVQLLMDTHKYLMRGVFFGLMKSVDEKPIHEWKDTIFNKIEQDLEIYPIYDFIKVVFLELSSVHASFSKDIIALEEDMIDIFATMLDYGQKNKNFSKLFDPNVAARCIIGGIKKIIADFHVHKDEKDFVKNLSAAYDFYAISVFGEI